MGLDHLRCARLPWVATAPALQAAIESVLIAHRDEDLLRIGTWALLQAQLETTAREGVRKELGLLGIEILPHLAIEVEVSFRIRILRPGLAPEALAAERTEVVPFDAAVSAQAAALDPAQVEWRLTELDLRPGRDAAQVRLTVPLRLMVEAVSVVDGQGVEVARRPLPLELLPEIPAPIQLPGLSLPQLHRLSVERLGWQVQVFLRGRPDPLHVGIPEPAVARLPAPEARYVLYLQGGRSSLRTLLRAEASAIQPTGGPALRDRWQWLPMEEALEGLELTSPGRVSWSRDPASLTDWLGLVLPAFSARIVRSLGAWLERVVLAGPGDDQLVATLSQQPGNQDLVSRWTLSGKLEVVPEAEAVVRHFRPALLAVSAVLRAHRKAYDEAFNFARRRLLGWMEAKQRKESPLLKHVVADPGPRPDDPPAFAPLATVPVSLAEALEADPELSRMAVVDVGAGGVDLAFYRIGQPLQVVRLEREAQGATFAENLVERIAGLAEPLPSVLLVTGGASADRSFVEPFTLALHRRGLGKIPQVTGPELGVLARRLLSEGQDAPALRRFSEVQALAGPGIPGRFDVLDGMRP